MRSSRASCIAVVSEPSVASATLAGSSCPLATAVRTARLNMHVALRTAWCQ